MISLYKSVSSFFMEITISSTPLSYSCWFSFLLRMILFVLLIGYLLACVLVYIDLISTHEFISVVSTVKTSPLNIKTSPLDIVTGPLDIVTGPLDIVTGSLDIVTGSQ